MVNERNPWTSFFPAWVLVNTLGWLAYTVVFILPYFGAWAALCIGFLIGLFQWAVLNRYIGIDQMWLWVSTLPYGLMLFIITLFGSQLTIFMLLIIETIILGLLGFVQCLQLRNYVNNALIWMAASPVASLLGTIAAWMVNFILFSPGGVSPLLFWALKGFVYGCITGVTVIFLENSLE